VSAEPIPISSLEHYRYCPRQSALILVEGVWVDNAATAKGTVAHRRVDDPGERIHRGVRSIRSVPLWSFTHGLVGRADVVEVTSEGEVVPVEHKSGYRHGDTADVQLCAQALCLEEMIQRPVRRGMIWYGGTRRRVPIAIDHALRELTIATIASVRALRDMTSLPDAVDDDRCGTCQLLAQCQPGVVSNPTRVSRFIETEVFRCRS
jgi:CRISPR-associated exonuclease Cas4